MKSTAFLFLIGIFLVGCAKEKEFDAIYKDNTFDKSLFSADPNDPYVYLPSVGDTPMNITASRPYWQGEAKLVVFKFRENTLDVLEIPTDKRFSRNENNYSPVFKLNIDHKDFRCAKDQFGDCANKEEEVNDAPWDHKRFFKADFSNLATLETNLLPEQLRNLFDKCFTEQGSVVKKLDIEKDAINITVQKTISAGVRCADLERIEDLRNLTFKVDYNYSFVKLSKLAAKDYQPVLYPHTDQNTFGFFSTTTRSLTADNRTTLDSDVTYMNRWNPERKEITFYLNDAFYDSDMKNIKDATYQAVQTINNTFTQAGVDLKLTLADGRGKNIGDLRNNFVILVKDPQASGVVGYGRSVANPQTGEIVKAQTVMYYGTIRKFIQETYEELVEEAKKKELQAQIEAAKVQKELTDEEGNLNAPPAQELSEVNSLQKSFHKSLLSALKVQDEVSVRSASGHVSQGPLRSASLNLNQRIKSEIFSHSRVHKHHSMEDMVEEMSRKNVYHESMVNWHGAFEAAIDQNAIDFKNAKPWNDLTESEKEKIITKLMPFVWIPTLVHEFGHNLGLRHNFNGSEDKDNFFSKDELAKLGIKRDIPYSSIMDYSYSSLNQLPVMGKYDIAALAFGYNREVELKDGKIAKIPKSTLEELKKDGFLDQIRDFRYCTDEHVSVNPGCNRFDEGTSLAEIAKHYVKAYHKNFNKRYTRNNRLDFSSFSDGMAYMSTRYTMHGLRLFFEVFDRIKGMYPSLPDTEWEKNEFLKDLKEATKVAADFYIDILKTPSVHCAILEKKTGNIVDIVPLQQITRDAISCFDEPNILLNEQYVAIAQTGKHLNHARSPYLRGDIKADPTQIDVRGIWIDKVLAMDYLTRRELGISTFDDYRTSFLDHKEFKDKILEAFIGFMNDKISTKSIFELPNNTTQEVENVFEVGSTHFITKSFDRALTNHLGITKASTDIRELFFSMMKKSLTTADDSTQTLGLLKNFSVLKIDPTTYVNPSELESVVDLRDKDGRVSARYAVTPNNVLAKKLVDERNVRLRLEKIPRQELINIFNSRVQGKIPEDIAEDLKDVYEMPMDTLRGFLIGLSPQDDLINRLFSVMSM